MSIRYVLPDIESWIPYVTFVRFVVSYEDLRKIIPFVLYFHVLISAAIHKYGKMCFEPVRNIVTNFDENISFKILNVKIYC